MIIIIGEKTSVPDNQDQVFAVYYFLTSGCLKCPVLSNPESATVCPESPYGLIGPDSRRLAGKSSMYFTCSQGVMLVRSIEQL